jgi:hypothetical protein
LRSLGFKAPAISVRGACDKTPPSPPPVAVPHSPVIRRAVIRCRLCPLFPLCHCVEPGPSWALRVFYNKARTHVMTNDTNVCLTKLQVGSLFCSAGCISLLLVVCA